MALLERVGRLIRANLNDLIDQAEDPEKMLKDVILDMQNQLLQVKTQVAIAIADQHLLIKKKKDSETKAADWKRKAALALDKNDEELARAAVERSITFDRMGQSFDQQIADQSTQVDNLKIALHKLEGKLDEARTRIDVLIAQHRRARAFNKAGEARMKLNEDSNGNAFDRMHHKVQRDEAVGLAKAELLQDSVEDRFAQLEKQEEIGRVLAGIKARRAV